MRNKFIIGLIGFFAIISLLLAGCMPSDATGLGDMYTNNIYPNPTNTYNNGSATYAWQNMYAYNYYRWNGSSWVTVTGGGGITSVDTGTPSNITGILTGNGSTLSSITDNSANWNTAYSNMIVGTPWTGMGYLTTNQTISLGGDLSGSGTTSISGTVTGIQGHNITLSSGFLTYSGSAWTFDNSTYETTSALGSWSGSSNITTLGTVTSGSWNATSIAVAHGGTGATSASDARTNLGLAIGTNVEAWNSALDAVAAGTWSGDGSITTVGNISSGGTYNGLTLNAATNGFTVAGGNTNSYTLTVTGNTTLSGTPLNGNVWTVGTSAPSGGNNGDMYYNTSTYHVWQKQSGTWTDLGSIQGAAGQNGADGQNGSNGSPGAAGQGYTWRGAWQSGTAYNYYNCVSYNYSDYICTNVSGVTSTTNPSLDPTNWQVMLQAQILGTSFALNPAGDLNESPALVSNVSYSHN